MTLPHWLKFVAIGCCSTTITYSPSLAHTSPVFTQHRVTAANLGMSKLAALNTLIIPGKSLGAITATTTYADLVKLFGKQRLKATKAYAPEGQAEFRATLITLGANKSLTVAWDNKNPKKILYIIIKDPAWKTSEGIGVGTSLTKLRQVLGEFQIGGFYWDYGNQIVDLSPAKQAKFKGLSIKVDADPQAAKQFPKDLDAVTGDGAGQPASSPRWKRLNIRVSEIEFYFPDRASN